MKKNKKVIFIALVLIHTHSLILGMKKNWYNREYTKKTISNLPTATDCVLQNEYKERFKALAQKAQEPDETCVSLWEANSIILSPTRNKPRTISAYGLNGCTATALHVVYDNGEQYAGMSHYPRASLNEQMAHVKQQCLYARAAQNKDKHIESINFVITWPDTLQKTDLLIIDPTLNKDIDQLKRIAYSKLRKEKALTMHLIPYNISSSLSKHPKPFKISLSPEDSFIISDNGSKHMTVSLHY